MCHRSFSDAQFSHESRKDLCSVGAGYAQRNHQQLKQTEKDQQKDRKPILYSKDLYCCYGTIPANHRPQGNHNCRRRAQKGAECGIPQHAERGKLPKCSRDQIGVRKHPRYRVGKTTCKSARSKLLGGTSRKQSAYCHTENSNQKIYRSPLEHLFRSAAHLSPLPLRLRALSFY